MNGVDQGAGLKPQQTDAFPVWGEGRDSTEFPPRDGGAVTVRGYRDVFTVFVRTWPFLLPQLVGRWRELPRGEPRAEQAANAGSESGQERAGGSSVINGNRWGFGHVPPLVTVLAAMGPLTGLLPSGVDSSRNLLLGATVLMAALCWALLFVKGRLFVGLSAVLVPVGVGANLFAAFAVEGRGDNLQVALVSLGCLCIWLVQYRIEESRIKLRVRVATHLAYYYLLSTLSTLVLTVSGLLMADLLNQSILQAEPLTPLVAGLINRPELGGERDAGAKGKKPDPAEAAVSAEEAASGATLSAEQRHDLKWLYVVLLIVTPLVTTPLTLAASYYYVWILQRINQDLRAALIERWHRLSLRYHGEHRVGDSVYRVYQDTAQITAVIGAVLKALPIVQTYAVAVVLLTALDPIIGAMALTGGLLALAWGRWFSPKMRAKSVFARETNSDLTSRVQETFAAIRLVKACGTEEHEQQRFEQESRRAFNAAFSVRSLIAVVGVVMFLLTALVLFAGEFLMAVWAAGGRETFATALVAMVGLSFVAWNLSAFTWSHAQLGSASLGLGSVVQLWAQAQDMAMGLDRAFHILDLEPDIENAPDARPMPPLGEGVRFKDVGFAYEEDRPVLNGVNLLAEPGAITAIVGPTGSGKSTLVGLLSRLFDPDSGSVEIGGCDLRAIDVESLRENVAMALQENVLFGMSVRDNIRYVVPDADDDQVLLAAEVACVTDYIDSLPEGLDTVLSHRGGKLSTGQRQRLSIARAIIKESPILVLDEPTAALDAATEHRVLDRLVRWSRGRAVFLITHRISTIQRADQILYLDQGEIKESGSHTDLMQIPNGRYRSFVETEERLSLRSGPTDAGGQAPEDGGAS